MNIDPVTLVQAVVTLIREINDASRNLRVHKEKVEILNGRIQRLLPKAQAMLNRPALAEEYKAALFALQLQLRNALKLSEECGKGKVYALLNHRRLKDDIIMINNDISHCVLDIHFIMLEAPDLVASFADVRPLRGAGPLEEAGPQFQDADFSNPQAVARAVNQLQQAHQVSVEDVAEYKADLAALERQNKELRERLNAGAAQCRENEESFMEQVIGLLGELELQQQASASEAREVEVPENFKCPISRDIMVDPVILETGITYERSQIEQWFRAGHRNCPSTKQELKSTTSIPNLALKNQIHEWALSVGMDLPTPEISASTPETPPSTHSTSPTLGPGPSLRTLSSFGSTSSRSLGERSFRSQDSFRLPPPEPRVRPDTLNGLKGQADAGDAKAQFELGMCYFTPARGAPYNPKEAFKWFKKAADAGQSSALALLAECYFKGVGVPAADKAEGVRCAREVEHLMEPTAKMILAMAHKEGSGGVEKDPIAADALFKDAKRELKPWAEEPTGDPLAQQELGSCYFFGIGTRKDEKLGLEWVEKAAVQGAATANAFLGWYYKQEATKKVGGGDGLSGKAFEYYRRAAELGHAGSQYIIGGMFLNGQGVPGSKPDRKKALEWFKKAAAGGSGIAQLALAECFQDKVDRVKYLKMAAEQGVAEAQYQLGVRYLNGDGVRKDSDKGREWLGKATDQNHAKAEACLAKSSKAKSRWSGLVKRAHNFVGAGEVFENTT